MRVASTALPPCNSRRCMLRTARALNPGCTCAAGSSADRRVSCSLPGAGPCTDRWQQAAGGSGHSHLAPANPAVHAGIIGTNLVDAEQTVDTMVQTQGSFRPVEATTPGAAGLRQLLQSRGVQASGRRRAGSARRGGSALPACAAPPGGCCAAIHGSTGPPHEA